MISRKKQNPFYVNFDILFDTSKKISLLRFTIHFILSLKKKIDYCIKKRCFYLDIREKINFLFKNKLKIMKENLGIWFKQFTDLTERIDMADNVKE